MKFALLAVVTLIANVGCTSRVQSVEEYLASIPIGHFKNLYEGCELLAGIEVHQLPVVDNAMEDYSVYIGKHPGTIDYHFWDGRICSVRYSPDGKILHREWSRHTSTLDSEGYTSWNRVDFTKGSDPTFEHHADPRRKP